VTGYGDSALNSLSVVGFPVPRINLVHCHRNSPLWTGILFSLGVLTACATPDTQKQPEGDVKVPMDTENGDFKTMHDEIMEEADQIPLVY